MQGWEGLEGKRKVCRSKMHPVHSKTMQQFGRRALRCLLPGETLCLWKDTMQGGKVALDDVCQLNKKT